MSGLLGQAVVSHLLTDNPFERIVGIDRRAPSVLGPVHYIDGDLFQIDLGELIVLNEINVILHCATAPLARPHSDRDLMELVVRAAAAKEAAVPARAKPNP